MAKTRLIGATTMVAVLVAPCIAAAQGTAADYERAMTLRDRSRNLALNVVDQTRWVASTHKLTYRRTVKGGYEFVLVDADTKAKGPAFDHAKLAAAPTT